MARWPQHTHGRKRRKGFGAVSYMASDTRDFTRPKIVHSSSKIRDLMTFSVQRSRDTEAVHNVASVVGNVPIASRRAKVGWIAVPVAAAKGAICATF